MAAKRLNSFWAKENRNIPLKSESDHINTINPSMHWWINCVNMITKIVQRCVLLLQCTTKSANNQYFWSSNEWLRTGTKSVWSHSTKRGVTFAMQNGTSRGRNLNYHFREIKLYFSCKAIFKRKFPLWSSTTGLEDLKVQFLMKIDTFATYLRIYIVWTVNESRLDVYIMRSKLEGQPLALKLSMPLSQNRNSSSGLEKCPS